MRLVVAGAQGQVGHLVVYCAGQAGVPTLALSSQALDIRDIDTVYRLLEPQLTPEDVLLNCAAYTAVDEAETHEGLAYEVNCTGAKNLAIACSRTGARMIQLSTDYVFSGAADRPYEVTDPTGPQTAYGRTKLAGEQAVSEYLEAVQIVRTAWVYNSVRGDFVATMRRLEAEQETVEVVNDQIGSPTYAQDLAEALVELAISDVGPGTLHLTNAGSASWYDLACEVFAEIGADRSRVRPCSTESFPRPALRPAYSVLAPTAWIKTGLTPLRDWQSALADALSGA
ncbi:MAG: dTDP-4-dehydrorhamnose reductase [Mycobacteriaceae bacterium]